MDIIYDIINSENTDKKGWRIINNNGEFGVYNKKTSNLILSVLNKGAISVSSNISSNFINLYSNINVITGYTGGYSKWTTTGGSNIYYNLGNVGIGTTNPATYPLVVGGDVNIIGEYRVNGSLFKPATSSIADTAIALATSRTIAGVQFDGTEDININYSNLINKPDLTVIETNNTNASNYILTTSNNLINKVRENDENASNYILTSSNNLINKVGENDNNASNYILTASNNLINKVRENDENASNYILTASNNLINKVVDNDNNASNYILTTSNNLINKVRENDENASNYILTSSNNLINKVRENDNNASNYILTTSNNLINKVVDNDNNASNYILTTSNNLINKVRENDNNASNYVLATSNIIQQQIKAIDYNTLINKPITDVKPNTSNTFQFSSGYNVGIGTSSALTPLHIYNITGATIRLQTPVSSGPSIEFIRGDTIDASTDWKMRSDAISGAFVISSSASGVDTSNRFVISNAGNIGIGTVGHSTHRLDVNGSLNATNYTLNGVALNVGVLSQGMTVQTKHLTYTQMDVKNNTGWDAINDDLVNGFVIAITPASASSKILVNMIAHIGTDQPTDSRWWGIKLYRKIGDGAWTEITGANGTETGASAATAGTPVWVSHNMGSTGTEYIYFISNLTGTYLDAPNTTSIVYYTAYWNQKLGDATAPTGNIFINRAVNHGDAYRPAPSSSWTATEIWDLGTPYTPPSGDTTITIASSYVGISATPNANHKLIVNQGTSGSTGATCFPLKISAGAVTNLGNSTATLIGLGTENNGTLTKCAIGHSRTGTYDVGSIVFLCNNTNDGTMVTMANERMRITSAGNVGIGTNNPLALLDVVYSPPAVANTDMLNIRVDGNWGLKLQQSYTVAGNIQYNLIHRYNAVDYNALTFKGANVGIGTASPAYKLHIRSNYSDSSSGLHFDANDNGNVNQYAMTIYPYVIGSGEIGWRFRTQNATGGTNTPLTLNNYGNVVVQNNLTAVSLTASGTIQSSSITSSSITSTNNITAVSLTASGAIQSSSLTSTNNITASGSIYLSGWLSKLGSSAAAWQSQSNIGVFWFIDLTSPLLYGVGNATFNIHNLVVWDTNTGSSFFAVLGFGGSYPPEVFKLSQYAKNKGIQIDVGFSYNGNGYPFLYITGSSSGNQMYYRLT